MIDPMEPPPELKILRHPTARPVPQAPPPRAPVGAPDPPDYLDDNEEALAEWARVVPRLIARKALNGEQSTSILVAYVESWARLREMSEAHRVGRASTREVFDTGTMWLRLARELQLTPAAEAKLEIERARKAAEHSENDPFGPDQYAG